MYEDLINELRKERCGEKSTTWWRAADAIEQLQAECQGWYKAYMDLLPTRWYSVEECLPSGADDSGAVCENVCLMMDDGTVSCGWMNGVTKKVYYLNARDDFVIKAPITRVTHWMPLPDPPKEEAE
jgi:hypothetical protein